MAKFDLIASTKGMDARAKLLELGNWFTGAPKLIVDAEAMDPDPEKAIEVDPNLDPGQGSKWIRLRIRPNVVDPGGSGSGSETLV